MASPDKKEKTTEESEAAPAPAAAPAKAEPLQELEVDEKKDKSEKIKDKVTFLTAGTTMNVMPSTVGNMLASLQDGTLGDLIAGACGNVGVKSGRYMFEAKVVESIGKKAMVRVGFAAEGTLILGEDENSICFDGDGFLVSNKRKTKCSSMFKQDTMVAVVLNLDSASGNQNTVSLFKDGVRVSAPQALPDALKDKPLFPAISFKHATVHYNFGPPVVPLPFTCKVLQEAVAKEVTITKYTAPEGGKCTAVFPVALPDEGGFDWLDTFLEKNRGYTEISDRAFMQWKLRSGGSSNPSPDSNDKPDKGDNASVRSALLQLASLQPRDVVIMEMKSNLIKEERAAAVEKMKALGFKAVADVVVKEPPSSFTKLQKQKALAAKQKKSDMDFKVKKLQEKKEWANRKKLKEIEKQKKKQEKEQKKKMAEIMKKKEEALKKAKKEMAAKKAKAEGKEVEEEVEEEPKPEEPEVEEPEEPEEPEPADEDPPAAELTSEEKAIKFFKGTTPDLTQFALNTSFTKFSTPEKDEGFDAVKYSWAKEADAKAYVKDWIVQRKLTTRVEDVTAGPWFKQRFAAWNSTLAAWKTKQNEYKAQVSKKAVEKAAKEKAKFAKKVAAERKAKLEADRKKLEESKKKSEDDKDEKPEEEKAPEPEPVAEVEDEVEEAEEPEPQIDFEGIDIFGVEDVCDIGAKIPLFKDFQFEDFALLSLRAELNLLVHSFSKDVEDPDRSGMHVDHMAFYYQKYFARQLSFQMFGVQTPTELIDLISDTIHVGTSKVVESLIPADLESFAVFVKLVEDARRIRVLALEMGDETAKLKIQNKGGDKRQEGNADGSDGKSEKPKWEQGEKRKWEGGNKWDGKGGQGKGKWSKWSW